jgi:hypothetical protein
MMRRRVAYAFAGVGLLLGILWFVVQGKVASLGELYADVKRAEPQVINVMERQVAPRARYEEALAGPTRDATGAPTALTVHRGPLAPRPPGAYFERWLLTLPFLFSNI